MSEVTKPIALDESFNTTGQTPKNIADVIKNGLQEVAQAIDSHQGGGGHVILDQNGNALDQEPNMQFVDAHLTDDSTNEKTVIENIKSATEADFRTATEDGLYDVDVEGAEIGEISEDYVEVKADGVKTLTQLFVELIKKCDTSKLNGNSYIKQPNGDLLHYQYAICFSRCRTSNADSSIVSLIYQGSNTAILYYSIITSSGTTINNGDSTPTDGTKITLYYGNDKAVVDLQTTANRCLMSDGTSLQIKTKTLTNPTCASNGAIETDLSSDKIIVSVFADIQVAHVYLGGVYDGKYYLQSANFSTGSINKSTTLSGNVTIQYFG